MRFTPAPNRSFLHMYVLFCLLALGVLLIVPPAFAQPPGMSFGFSFSDNASDENSRFPVKIELRGFLNTDPTPESLSVVSLGVNSYSGIYKFDIRQARVVDEIRIPISAILRRTGKYVTDFTVSGRRELLSKIGQSPPGTPLVITGMFQQRRRRLTLLGVDIVGIDQVMLPAQEAMPEAAVRE